MVKDLMEHYIKSTVDIVAQMAQIELVQEGDIFEEKTDYQAIGVSSVITFAGTNIKGRFILDFSPFLALKIAAQLMGEQYSTVKNLMVLAVISEINNTIAGDANTMINNKLNLSLWLAPPIACSGKNLLITKAKKSNYSALFSSRLGKVRINLAITEVLR